MLDEPLLPHLPLLCTARSYSRSDLLATTITGKKSRSLTRNICWWNWDLYVGNESMQAKSCKVYIYTDIRLVGTIGKGHHSHFLKTTSAGNAIDKKESLPGPHILFAHSTVWWKYRMSIMIDLIMIWYVFVTKAKYIISSAVLVLSVWKSRACLWRGSWLARSHPQSRTTNLYSSCPAVSRTSRSATSPSMTHCLRYESVEDTMQL